VGISISPTHRCEAGLGRHCNEPSRGAGIAFGDSLCRVGLLAVHPARTPESLACIWDYCEESARIIFGSEERLDALTKSILDKLEATGESGMTRNEIRNALNRNTDSAKIVCSLGKLLEMKKARFEKQNTGGKRPAERWYAVTRSRD
jgi:hypothetical protein